MQAQTLGQLLLVDPDRTNRAIYAEALRLAGFDVSEASDGRTALTRALIERPSVVVLMEVRLLHVDGYSLCQVLSRDRETQSAAIVALIDEAHRNALLRLRTAGADAVLIRPIEPEVLLRQTLKCLTATSQRQRGAGAPTSASSEHDPTDLEDAAGRRRPLVKSYERFTTTEPPRRPPALICPSCDHALTYECSHIGGVSERYAEQWDDYRCSPCGSFQFRHRTRRLRSVERSKTAGTNNVQEV